MHEGYICMNSCEKDEKAAVSFTKSRHRVRQQPPADFVLVLYSNYLVCVQLKMENFLLFSFALPNLLLCAVYGKARTYNIHTHSHRCAHRAREDILWLWPSVTPLSKDLDLICVTAGFK